MAKAKNSLIIFDGSNFYHSIKKITPQIHLSNFRYRDFSEYISNTTNNRIIYCVGEIRRSKNSVKSEKLYSHQQSLFYYLEKQKIEVIKGFMLKNGSEYHEKGVDVRIALEIQRGAIKNEYQKCFIISSDTDIIPAIIDARKEKKQLVYVGFDKNLSRAMQSNCDQTIIVDKETIRKFEKISPKK